MKIGVFCPFSPRHFFLQFRRTHSTFLVKAQNLGFWKIIWGFCLKTVWSHCFWHWVQKIHKPRTVCRSVYTCNPNHCGGVESQGITFSAARHFRSWDCQLVGALNLFSQYLQAKGKAPVWMFSWFLNENGQRKKNMYYLEYFQNIPQKQMTFWGNDLLNHAREVSQNPSKGTTLLPRTSYTKLTFCCMHCRILWDSRSICKVFHYPSCVSGIG